jgi:hypothetical protein
MISQLNQPVDEKQVTLKLGFTQEPWRLVSNSDDSSLTAGPFVLTEKIIKKLTVNNHLKIIDHRNHSTQTQQEVKLLPPKWKFCPALEKFRVMIHQSWITHAQEKCNASGNIRTHATFLSNAIGYSIAHLFLWKKILKTNI